MSVTLKAAADRRLVINNRPYVTFCSSFVLFFRLATPFVHLGARQLKSANSGSLRNGSERHKTFSPLTESP